MRTSARLAATAGMTVLGVTAMSGMAQADTGGLGGLGGLTGPLTKTVNGVVKSTLNAPSTSRSSSSSTRSSHGTSLNLPLHVRVRLPDATAPSRHRGTRHGSTHSREGSLATVDVNAVIDPDPQVQASVGLCASLAQECGVQSAPPSPPAPPPAQPPGPAPVRPPGVNAPATASGSQVHGAGSLPFTGGPIGSLAFLGAMSILTGAAGIATSRVRRES